jgi:zinc-binding in reverse transcriptase
VHEDGIYSNEVQVQKQQLRNKVTQMLLQSNVEDSLHWIRGTQGFTVKSSYDFIQNRPAVTSHLKNIWQIPAPPRVLIFAWLILRYSILTINNLKKRGWQLPKCIMYFSAEESINHLFQDCGYIRETRTYIHDNTQIHNQPSTKYRRGDISMISDKREDMQWRRLKLTTVFVIWRERCARIFRDEHKQYISIVREILLEFKQWYNR